MAQPLPPDVRPCLDEAVARSSRLIGHAVEVASLTLQEEAETRSSNAREWRNLQDAALELARRGRRGRDSFPAALRLALAAAAEPAASTAPPGRAPASLSLVDDGEITLSIETARLVQQVAPRLDTALAELDALMSAALGLPGIDPARNPLRPAIIAGELRRCLLEPAPERPEWSSLWLRHLAEPLSHELEQLYRAASRLLSRAGVQAAPYRVVTAPAPLTAATGDATGDESASPLSNWGSLGRASSTAAVGAVRAAAAALTAPLSAWFHSAAQILRGPVLREFLAGGPRLPLQQPLDAGWYAHVDQELDRIEAMPEAAAPPPASPQHRHLPPTERPPRPVGTGSALDPRHWGIFAGPRQRSLVRTRLKQQARRVDQALGVELVHQLLDEVAQDARLLAPVREAMVALEPALARLAIDAPRFVGESDHPGRGLLEGVADRSLRYNDEGDPAFERFIAPVREQFNRLNREEAAVVEQAFGRALRELESRWGQEDRQEAQRQEEVLAAVRLADARQELAEQLAATLAQREDLEGTPAVVQEFLFETWSLVLAQARLQDPGHAVDPGGYLAVVSDLLWSAKPRQTMRAPARAFALIPPLLARLREGLQLLGRPEDDTRAFFRALEQLHAPVLRLRALKRQQGGAPVPPLEAAPAALAPVTAQTPRPVDEPWLAPVEAQACGLQAQPDAVPAAAGAGVPHEPPEAEAAAAQARIAALAEDSWVDLQVRGQWRRARLAWRGTRGTLFMFLGEGGEPHSMSRRVLQRLLAQRQLVPVEAGAVVQDALAALAHAPAQALAA